MGCTQSNVRDSLYNVNVVATSPQEQKELHVQQQNVEQMQECHVNLPKVVSHALETEENNNIQKEKLKANDKVKEQVRGDNKVQLLTLTKPPTALQEEKKETNLHERKVMNREPNQIHSMLPSLVQRPEVPPSSWYAAPFTQNINTPITEFHYKNKGHVIFSTRHIPVAAAELEKLPHNSPSTCNTFILGKDLIYGMAYLHNTPLFIEHYWRNRVSHLRQFKEGKVMMPTSLQRTRTSTKDSISTKTIHNKEDNNNLQNRECRKEHLHNHKSKKEQMYNDEQSGNTCKLTASNHSNKEMETNRPKEEQQKKTSAVIASSSTIISSTSSEEPSSSSPSLPRISETLAKPIQEEIMSKQLTCTTSNPETTTTTYNNKNNSFKQSKSSNSSFHVANMKSIREAHTTIKHISQMEENENVIVTTMERSEASLLQQPFVDLLIGLKVYVDNELVPDHYPGLRSLPQCTATLDINDAINFWVCVPFVLIGYLNHFMLDPISIYRTLSLNFVEYLLRMKTPEDETENVSCNLRVEVVYGCRAEAYFCTDFISRGSCTLQLSRRSKAALKAYEKKLRKLIMLNMSTDQVIRRYDLLTHKDHIRSCPFCGQPLRYVCTVCGAEVCGKLSCARQPVVGYPRGCSAHKVPVEEESIFLITQS